MSNNGFAANCSSRPGLASIHLGTDEQQRGDVVLLERRQQSVVACLVARVEGQCELATHGRKTRADPGQRHAPLRGRPTAVECGDASGVDTRRAERLRERHTAPKHGRRSCDGRQECPPGGYLCTVKPEAGRTVATRWQSAGRRDTKSYVPSDHWTGVSGCPRLPSDQIGVFGCGQTQRPAPRLCGAGNVGLWCAI